MDHTRKIFVIIVGITIVIISISVSLGKGYINFSPKSIPTNIPTETISESATRIALSSLTPTVRPPDPTSTPTPTIPSRMVNIIIDDYKTKPYADGAMYHFNRLDGDRGVVNDSILDWDDGQMKMTISQGNSWGGLWTSLNHPIAEKLPINFAAILPSQILPAYQSKIVAITAVIAKGTPNTTFRLELKNGGDLQWKNEVTLNGGRQIIEFDLPELGNVNELLWVLDGATAGDYVIVENISFTASTQIEDTETAVFVWSYSILLNNWNSATGLVRDKAYQSSGEFDAIQATSSLAAATAMAEQLRIISYADAVQIINKISHTLLVRLPRHHGLLPHFVHTSSTGKIGIAENTEWSSVDTVISAIGLLSAQHGLKLDTSDAELLLQTIDWDDVHSSAGISHGYAYSGDLLTYNWDVFGGESWLVELAYAAATGQTDSMLYASPPTANGSGFIDELAWLFVPPPPITDYWGTDWTAYRSTAADQQIAYYTDDNFQFCLDQAGLFGLSAAGVPDLSLDGYRAFGTGGRFSDPNDTTASGEPVIIPHYSAMIASLHPQEAIKMWDWLIDNQYFSPLNNAESLSFPPHSSCDPTAMTWNHVKGSWNLSLQTLGWGRYLAQREGQVPILWKAVETNSFLSDGYHILETAAPPSQLWPYERECESPDEHTVGQTMKRDDASNLLAHAQFGTISEDPWSKKSGYVQYNAINVPQNGRLSIQLRYSKHSISSTPLIFYIDDEPEPRATRYLRDQQSWETFVWTNPISLGDIEEGTHTLKIFTDGQLYGVADLDKFILTVE